MRSAAFILLLPLLACDDEAGPNPDAGTSISDPVDPLSMPATPTFVSSAFQTSSTCESCHPNHVFEWRTSAHAYAMRDPLFRKLVEVRSRDFEGTRDAFCIQCHSAIGTRSREVVPGFRFEDLSPVSLEGVTCESCHKISSVQRLHNSGHVLDPDGPMRGPIADPVEGATHTSEASEDFSRSELCAGCHDVVEFTGLPLERPYQEWSVSPSGIAGETCQSCHMKERRGQAAATGPERTIHEHRFVGVDVPSSLSTEERADLSARVEELLRGAASLSLRVEGPAKRGERVDLVVEVTNQIRGHNLPTGTTFHRQCWVDLSVRDSEGRVIYRTGDLDANGDLRDHFSELDAYGDSDLIRFGSRFVDAAGNPTLFPWKAAEHISSAIPPGYTRASVLYVDTSSAAVGPLSIAAELRFRPVPPFLLRVLGLAEEVERLEIYRVATASITVSLED